MREVLWLIEFESLKESAKFKKMTYYVICQKSLVDLLLKKFFRIKWDQFSKQARRDCQKSEVSKLINTHVIIVCKP